MMTMKALAAAALLGGDDLLSLALILLFLLFLDVHVDATVLPGGNVAHLLAIQGKDFNFTGLGIDARFALEG
ncbi:MAG: hypothetical protein KBT28_07335, partial [Bacteroidales bacterium]|nr:hypothetical protein [Candidatus Colimorpha merdihippi]